MSDRLVVDLTLCRGHGICMLVFADRVELDEWGFPVVDGADLDTRKMLRRARRAVAACPTGALRVEAAHGVVTATGSRVSPITPLKLHRTAGVT